MVSEQSRAVRLLVDLQICDRRVTDDLADSPERHRVRLTKRLFSKRHFAEPEESLFEVVSESVPTLQGVLKSL